jgi:hypothetical protein
MTAHGTTMTVECRTCPVRELQCGDCMVPVLIELTAPSGRPEQALDPEERAAVTRLVEAGLVDIESAAGARAVADPVSDRAAAGGSAPSGGTATVGAEGSRAVG